jgi:hypothetical protein
MTNLFCNLGRHFGYKVKKGVRQRKEVKRTQVSLKRG